MLIEFLLQDEADRVVLRAVRSEEDRPLPVSELIFDLAPSQISNDRVAIAGTALFGSFADHEISFSIPISAVASKAIVDATGLAVTSEISPTAASSKSSAADAEVSDRPHSVTTLTVGLGCDLSTSTPDVDCTRLNLIPGERFQGSLHGVKELVVASNAWYVASHVGNGPVLAASGLVFANDLLARALVLESVDVSAPSAKGIRALVEAAGIDLQ